MEEDFKVVIVNGLWEINGWLVNIRLWELGFKLLEVRIEELLIWVVLLEFFIELYDLKMF